MGNDMKTPFILSLIASILILLNGIAIIVISSIAGSMFSSTLSSFSSVFNVMGIGGIGTTFTGMAGAFTTMMIIMGIAGLVFGLITLLGSIWMRKPEKAKTGSILVLVFSIISIFVGGGFLIGLILGIVGGAIGISKAK